MTAELIGWIGIGLIVASLTTLAVLVHRAPVRPDLAEVDADLDQRAGVDEAYPELAGDREVYAREWGRGYL